MKKQWLGLVLGPLVFMIILFFGNFQDLPPKAQAVLATTMWMAIWWLTEVVPIAITALLPLILFPLSGAVPFKEASASYGHNIVFLFLGGFMLATAIERWGLHRRVALGILAKIGTSPKKLILGLMISTGFISMWISNTATTMMMVPIGIAIIIQLYPEVEKLENPFAKALLLGIAYSASIGGIATLIGTPTNVVFTGIVWDKYQEKVSFASWMILATPPAALLLIFCWYYLVNIGFKLPKEQEEDKEEIISRIKVYQKDLGAMSYEEKIVALVFGSVAFMWITREFFFKNIIALDDTIIALIGAMLLFIIPVSKSTKEKIAAKNADSFAGILDWETAVKIPWDVLLLFGGGLSMAAGFESSGLAIWLGSKMTLLGSLHLFFLLLIVMALVNLLSEVSSNVAAASMILPILASLSDALGIHPYFLMIGATCAASFGFMLPVATAPNAIVFGSGYLKMGDMVKAGFWLNVTAVVLFTIYIYIVLPMVLI